MKTHLESPVHYELPIGKDLVSMNGLIGKYIILTWQQVIHCIACGRKSNKSFAQGFCYPCFISAPETSECILRPELCQAHEGVARDMDWAEKHCLQEHFVYLAISSGVKVGVTRSSQIPTRWIDQGAWQAIMLAKTPNRYTAGLIEVALKQHISDRTQWQRMLKNQLIEGVDLQEKKQEMIGHLSPELQRYESQVENITEISFPVNEYPEKVKSVGFDKYEEISGRLWGIKGQYLIFDDGRVLNIRKHNGYLVEMEV
ncbi:MAG: DUF2797 domain-containing protein [Candidatus Marinimicrobia bacterium]|nr:DUF2797 domain-containing protein [Candidatus Neomarinimicrobiota bacterium]MDP6852497.1 DUF2797 domain-containing protein [Candidatus Neomarinimicrobiota bacterium]MDP6936036.1 DUF2797 domain-containing protein [Candidatus Neomarinimicrobiota bacterium]